MALAKLRERYDAGDQRLLESPRVSFVIPTKNNGRTLKRCLDSIFSQTLPKNQVEVIIVDGGSTDETVQIAKLYRTRIVQNPSVHQDGFLGGRNHGFRISNGEFIVFLNADQYLSSPKWISSMLHPLESDVTLAASISPLMVDRRSAWLNRYNSYVESPFLTTVARWLGERSYGGFKGEKTGSEVVSLSGTGQVLLFIGTGMIVRRKVLEAAGGYDFDLDTGFRAVSAGYKNYCLVHDVGFFHCHYDRNSIRAYVSHKVLAMRWFLIFRTKEFRRTSLEDHFWGRSSRQLRAWLISTLSAGTLLGSFMEARRLYLRNRDSATFFHIVGSIIALTVIATSLVASSSGRNLMTSRIRDSHLV